MDSDAAETTSARRYTLAFVLCLLALLAATAAFNASVDPYQYLSTPAREGFNAHKTTLFYHLPAAKSWAFKRTERTNLMLGTSRAGSAISPDHPAISRDNYYNFAIPGCPPKLDYIKLESAVRRGGVTKVIFFVDFFAFNTANPLSAEFTNDFSARLSAPLGYRSIWQGLKDFSSYFWSYQTIGHSVLTVKLQDSASAGEVTYTNLYENGHWNLRFSDDRNVLKAFQNLERSYLRGNWFPESDPRFSLNRDPTSGDSSLEDLRRILTLAQESNIEMTLIILPVHARLLENLSRAGLWPMMETWKREIVKANETVASVTGRPPFRIWDFYGYNEFATEPVTRNTAYGDLKWMYDAGHPTVETGNRILDIVFNGAEPGIGGELTGKNIKSWLARQRELRVRYREQYPDTVEQVRRQAWHVKQAYPWEVEPFSG